MSTATDTELYLDLILDHYRHPRNFGSLSHPTHRARGHNPLCGDRVELELIVNDERIEEIRFQGSGCAISTASASLMSEAVKGRSVREAQELFHLFHRLITGDGEATTEVSEKLGKITSLVGVRHYPVRIKCATLPWHALRAALENGGGEVSTE